MNSQTSFLLWKQLREELLPWTIVPIVIMSFVLVFANLSGDQIMPPSLPVYGMLGLVLAILTFVISRQNCMLAAWSLSIGYLLIIGLAWRWFPMSNAYMALVLPTIIANMTLGTMAGLAMTVLSTIFLGLDIAFGRPLMAETQSIIVGAMTLWGTAFLMAISQQPGRTMINWAWQGYDQARKHLAEARDRQVELKQTLEDLDLANREVIRLNDLLAAAREAVEEASRAKEEFVTNVSHELRTPLNMIIGFSDEILERPNIYAQKLPEELLGDIEAINRNSRHLAQLVDDVLDLVEAESGFTRLSKTWNSLDQVIHEAADVVRPFFQKKSLRLDVQINEPIPAAYFDRLRIRQVILNLLSNAARFTKSGGATISASAQQDRVTIKISDTGTGIHSASIKHMFQPFQQADPSIRRQYGGTGLGLAITKRFVELHKGRIDIESKLGIGTTVSFSLPIHEDDASAGPRRWFSPFHHYESRTRPSLAPGGQTTPRILIIEEGEALANLVKHYLHDVEITSAPTMRDASQVMQKEAIRAIVINEMVGDRALSTISTLTDAAFDIPIMTCWVPETKTAVRRMGVQDYLVKPIERGVLLESMRRTAPEAQRVLLVEDDPEAQILFRRMLSAAAPPYTIAQATDGAAALQLLREWKPDLMLLDLVLPGQDGFEVLAKKAEEERIKDIPVIIISGRDPQREPVISNALLVTRAHGLSVRDLASALEATLAALPPRFAAPTRPETPVPSSASG